MFPIKGAIKRGASVCPTKIFPAALRLSPEEVPRVKEVVPAASS